MKRSVMGAFAILVGLWTVGAANLSGFPIAAAKQPSGSTLVEITGTTISFTPAVVYTVPAGQHLVLTDIQYRGGCPLLNVYRGSVLVTRLELSGTLFVSRSYQTGIEFRGGDLVQLAMPLPSGGGQACPPDVFFELRGYQEPQ